jgi:hypothetical protein
MERNNYQGREKVNKKKYKEDKRRIRKKIRKIGYKFKCNEDTKGGHMNVDTL